MLMYILHFEIRIRKQPRLNRLKSGVRRRQKDSRNVYYVAGVNLPRKRAIAVDR